MAQGQGQVTYAYFYSGDAVGPGKIYAVPAGGGAPVLLVVGSAGDQIGFALSFDDTNLYYGNYQESSGAIGARTSLVMHPIYAGAPLDLVEGLDEVTAITTDDQNVYFVNFNGSTNLTGYIGRVPKVGGAAQHLVELADTEGQAPWPSVAASSTGRRRTARSDASPCRAGRPRLSRQASSILVRSP